LKLNSYITLRMKKEIEKNPEEKVYQLLEQLDIPYTLHNHPAAFTVDQANFHWEEIPGFHLKNLFLRDKKGRKHFLVIIAALKQMDVKALNHQINERLSFASPQRLKKYLSVAPGSVSPFGLMNDLNHEVIVLLDSDLQQAEYVNFHPNNNTITMNFKQTDLLKYINYLGNPIQYVEL